MPSWDKIRRFWGYIRRKPYAFWRGGYGIGHMKNPVSVKMDIGMGYYIGLFRLSPDCKKRIHKVR